MNKTFGVVGSLVLTLTLGACSQPTSPRYGGSTSAATPQESVERTAGAPGSSSVTQAGSVKGTAGQMPAFYDGELFTINSVEVSDVAADQIGANKTHNDIYVTNDLDEEQDFIPVIDAIQGDGFNPLWEQFLIVFNPGATPHQFFSDEEVEDAAAGSHPEIRLVDTHEVYRCSVVGSK